VFVAVVVVDVTETKVENDVVAVVVDVNMVETTVEVAVVVTSPPKGANLRIVDSAFVEIDVKPGLDPTTQPLLGDVM
jgi:predicted RNA methylase